jgi:hypothetical protein
MAHWSGVRSGWNTRGGTPKEHLRNHMDYLEHQKQLKDPNSSYWQTKAEITHLRLEELLNSDFELWAEITWPDDTIEQQTYREIYERMDAALKLKELIFQELECTCNGVIALCKVCRASEWVRARNGNIVAETEC